MATRKPPKDDAQLELFSAIFSDIVSRETQDTMEVPFLSLSKRPRFAPIRYSVNGVEVTVSGGEPQGIANIWDWDLIIWLLSQIRHAADSGQSVSRKIRFSRWSYLKDARRHTSGREYKRLEDTIARLRNTSIRTTIRANKGSRTVMFSWIEYAEVERDEKGNVREATVVLPEWLFEAVCDHRLVLTLHRDYFLLTGGIERWLYRFIRKGAGNRRDGWSWKFKTLHARSGSTQSYKYFARDLREIISHGRLLDYSLEHQTRDSHCFLHAKKLKPSQPEPVEIVQPTSVDFLRLRLDSYERAKLAAPGLDVYVLEQQWREFNQGREDQIKNPDAAFIAFCRTHARRNPIPAR